MEDSYKELFKELAKLCGVNPEPHCSYKPKCATYPNCKDCDPCRNKFKLKKQPK